MPTYPGPPAFPWIVQPEAAFRPVNVWAPCDEGPVRDFLGNRPAARSGSTALGRGDWGPALVYSGGTALTSALPGTLSACSITSFHRASSAGNGAIFGIGTSGQIGLLYYNGQFGINSFSGVLNNAITLSPPTAAGRAVTVCLAGFTNGSPVSIWIDGVLVYSNALTLNVTNPGGSAIRLGASGNSSWPWAGSIGPTYLHDRVLSDREIRRLHANPWRIFKSHRIPEPTLLRMVNWPFSAAGAMASPAGTGVLPFSWAAFGAGLAQAVAGAGAMAFDWPLSGEGLADPAAGSGSLLANWAISGDGIGGDPAAEGELAFDWSLLGDGTAASPIGSGSIGAAWYFAGAGIAAGGEGIGLLDWPWTFGGIGIGPSLHCSGVFEWDPPPIVLPDPRRCVIRRIGGDPARAEARRK